MASYRILTWRNIPAAVEAQAGSESATRQLSERFQALIDSAAMQLGLEDSDRYLEGWQRSEPAERAGTAQAVVDAVVAELEERFPDFIGQAFHR